MIMTKVKTGREAAVTHRLGEADVLYFSNSLHSELVFVCV